MTTYRNFHPGEVQLQTESGIDTAAFDAGVEQPFQPALNPSEIKFVGQRSFSIAASLDAAARPWASPLLGPSGELFSVVDPLTVEVRSQEVAGDPLVANITTSGELGVLYFDPARRRRAKSLGHATIGPDGVITYQMTRSFGICNKYIFKRSHEMSGETPRSAPAPPSKSTRLDAEDQAQLGATDTVFLASHHVEHGTDPTHRGGPSGFVTVRDAATVALPDYLGNGMFQTLGNLLLDDRVGLLSLDFVTGRSLQLTGRGAIEPSAPDDPYSTRTLVIAVEEVRTSWPDVGTWTDIEAFDLKPGLVNPGTPFL